MDSPSHKLGAEKRENSTSDGKPFCHNFTAPYWQHCTKAQLTKVLRHA